jgi:hypothetical protein
LSAVLALGSEVLHIQLLNRHVHAQKQEPGDAGLLFDTDHVDIRQRQGLANEISFHSSADTVVFRQFMSDQGWLHI